MKDEIVFFGRPVPESVAHIIRSIFGIPLPYVIGIMIMSTMMFILKLAGYRLPDIK